MKPTALAITLTALLMLAAPLTGHADDDRGNVMDLTFEEADVRVVLTKIAEDAGANVIVHPDVKGRITIDLRAVPWRKALEAVAQAAGARVKEEDFGILRVIPARPRAKRAVAGSLRYEEARRELARIEARMAEAAAARRQEEVARLQAEVEKTRERVSKLKALDAARASAEAFRVLLEKRDAEAKAQASKHQVLRLYDVRDVSAKHPGVSAAIVEMVRCGATVQRKEGQLIVKARPAQHERLVQALGKARGDEDGPGVVTVTGKSVGKKTVRITMGPDGKVIAREVVKDEPAAKAGIEKPGVKHVHGTVTVRSDKTGTHRVTLDESGRVIEKLRLKRDPRSGLVILDDHGRAVAGAVQAKTARARAKVAAARKRIEDLFAAARHLDAAGAKAEAKRLHARIAEARKTLAQDERELVEAERAQKRLRVRVAQEPRARRDTTEGLGTSIRALHEEVRALRGEVRELTELVRRLLDRR